MYLVYFLIQLIFFTSSATTVTVDADLASTPSEALQNVLNSLINDSTGQLKDPDNTVILLANTVGIPQVINSFILHSSDSGSIQITSERLESGVSQPSDCSNLPIIALQANSVWDVTGLESFYIEGVFLQTDVHSVTPQFRNIETVVIQNACLRDGPYTAMLFENILDMRMSNSTLFNSNGLGYVFKLRQNGVFENLKIYYEGNALIDQFLRITNYTENVKAGMAVVTNIEVTCTISDYLTFHPPVQVLHFEKAHVMNYGVKNCSISESLRDVLWIAHTADFIAQNIYFSDIKIDWAAGSTKDFAVINSEGSNASISNITLDKITLTTKNYRSGKEFIILHQFFEGPSIHNVQLKDVMIKNSEFFGYSGLVHVEKQTMVNFGYFIVDNFTVMNCSFDFVMFFKFGPLDTGMSLTTQVNSLSNVLVSDCHFNDSGLFQLNNPYLATAPIELYAVQVTNITLQHSTFVGSGLSNVFEMLSTYLRIVNFTAENNSLSGCSLAVPSAHVSSFMLINATISNLRLDQGAAFLSYNLGKSLGYPSSDFYVNSTTVLLETRPFMIVNTTFQEISIENQSSLIISNNPTVTIVNCSFDEIMLDGSSFITFGTYTPIVPLVGKTFLNSPGAEEGIFQDLSDLLEMHRELPSKLAAYTADGSDSYFYIVLQNTVFQNIYLTNGLSLIGATGITNENSILFVERSTLSNIQVSTDQDFGIIKLAVLKQAVLSEVSFSNISGDGTVFQYKSPAIMKLLITTCSIRDANGITGYQIKASVCGVIEFIGSSVSSIESTKDWMQIDCDLISSAALSTNGNDEGYPSPITIQNSSFSDVVITSIAELLLSPVFLRLGTSENSSNLNTDSSSYKNIAFKNVIFKNIVLDKTVQTYAREMFTSPIIQITASQLEVIFDGVALNGLSITPNDHILSMSAVKVSFLNSSFKNLIHYERKGAIYLVLKALVINGSIFQDNQGLDQSESGLMTFVNPDETTPLSIAVESTSFIGNKAPMATLMFIEGFSVILNITNSEFSDNIAQEAGLILLQSTKISELYFKNVTFSYSAEVDSVGSDFGILEVKDCQEKIDITINNCNLDMGGYMKGWVLIFQNNNESRLEVSGFKYNAELPHNGSTSFGMMRADKIDATFDNIAVTGLNLSHNSLFDINCEKIMKVESTLPIIYNGSSVLMKNSVIDILTLGQGCNLFHLNANDFNQSEVCQILLSIEGSNFSNIDMRNSDIPALSEDGIAAFIKTDSSQFIGKELDQNILKLESNKFQHILGIQGSIYFGQKLQYGAVLYFKNNTFEDISVSKNGSIIYLSNTSSASASIDASNSQSALRNLAASQDSSSFGNISIIECHFEGINAQNGGVFYSTYATQGNTVVTLQSNSFLDISADERGGIFYMNDNTLFLTSNTFQNISAGVVGPLIYGNIFSLTSSTFNSTESGNIFDAIKSSMDENFMAFNPNTFEIELVSQEFGVMDEIQVDGSSYQILRNISSFSLEGLELNFTLYYKNEERQVSQKVITQSSQSQILFSFYSEGSDTSFNKSNGNCNQSVCTLKSPSITLYGQAYSKVKVAVNYTSKGDLNYQVSTHFYIEIRECMVGEINNTASGSCVYCQAGTYSLNTSDKECSACPQGAVCNGGSSVIPEPDYWKSSNSSYLIIPCPLSKGRSRCLGGADNLCADEFQGPVCLQCNGDNEFISNGKGECTQCSSRQKLIAIGVVLLVVNLAIQIYTLITIYKDNNKAFDEILASFATTTPTSNQLEGGTVATLKNASETSRSPVIKLKPGSYLTIFSTFSQITSIFSTLIPGGVFATNLFTASKAAGNPNEQALFSLQCLLFLEIKDPFEMLRLEVLLFVFSPVIKILILLVIELILAILHRKSKDHKDKLIMKTGVTVVGLIMLEQPGIVGTLSNYLFCQQLDPSSARTYVVVNPNVECGTDQYIQFRNIIVIPAVVIWTMIVPFVIFLFLRWQRSRLMNSRRVYVVFGGLYCNYTDRAYYWGIIMIVFKVIVYLLNSVLKTSAFGKGVAIIIVIHCYHKLYRKASPHPFKEVQRAEDYIIRSFQWTLLLILFCTIADGNNALQIVIEVGIAIVNVLAVSYLFFKLFSYHKATVIQLMRKFIKRKAKPEKAEPIEKEQSGAEESAQVIDISRSNVLEAELQQR